MTKISHDSETPAHGQQVIVPCAFIHHNFDGIDKVFLPKRALTKKFLPGVYELPGGHLDFGEELKTGLQREIFEEFGMHSKIGDPFYAFTYLNEVKGSHSIEVIFYATFTDPIENIKVEPEDHSEYGWFSETEVENLFTTIKTKDDPEFHAIQKGFQLLNGSALDFS